MANYLTVRADGVEVGQIHETGSRTVMVADQDWAAGEIKTIVVRNKAGDTWQEKQTLRQRLGELTGDGEHADELMAKCAGAAVVTIRDEYRY